MSKARSFVFTINNYTEDDVVACDTVVCKYICYGQEVGECGTPHLQGYISFATPRTLSSVSKKLKRAHLDVARGTVEDNVKYCSKEQHGFVERGVRPMTSSEGGSLSAQRYALARAAAREGRFDDIPDDLHARFDKYYQRVYFAEKSKNVPDGVPHISEWMWGRSGCGKSTTARKENPGAYLKMRNKWWDDYQFEETVIIDDVDPTHELKFGAFLKDYADHHKFRVEMKGSSCVIRPLKIVVTSQYPIEHCFKEPETIEALKRRFKVRFFGDHVFNPALRPVLVTGDHYP
jgi:hypothetical protein